MIEATLKDTMFARLLYITAGFVLIALAGTNDALGQQFVYEPTNPAFGGSYLNYQWLLNSAEVQKKEEEAGTSRFSRDPLGDFQTSLQRQILSQLSRELITNRFRDLDLTEPGRFDLGDFIVEVVPGLNEININIFNVLTGDETTVTIPSF